MKITEGLGNRGTASCGENPYWANARHDVEAESENHFNGKASGFYIRVCHHKESMYTPQVAGVDKRLSATQVSNNAETHSRNSTTAFNSYN